MAVPDVAETGVLVPVGLCRALHRLAHIGARHIQERAGGLPLVEGMEWLLNELAAASEGVPRTVVSVQIHPCATGREGWLSVGQAAELAQRSTGHVRALARGGRLIARRVGRDWQLDPYSVEDYAKGRNVA